MAKKKGNAAKVAGDAPQSAGPPSRAISLFPAKPTRSNTAPGISVRLITNLFRISLKQEKPIHRYTIEIDQVAEGDDANKSGVPRKISKEIRQLAVKQAVQDWLKNNNVDKSISDLNFSYVLDGNSSTMFSLFDMPLAPTGKMNKMRLEVQVCIKVPFVDKGKLVQENKKFQVRFHDGQELNVRELMDFCSGKGVQDSERYKDHVRALNVIFLGEIVTIPRFVVSQSAKSGFGSVFNYDRRNQCQISGGIICNKGFSLSVRPTEGGLVLNVANTVAPFYQPLTLLELLKNRFRVDNFSRNLSPFIRDSLEKELKLKQIEATHINYGTQQKPHYRKYRVEGISKTSVTEQTFDIDGKKMSVYDYFKKEYPKVNLKFPNLPCVIDKSRYIPIEVCQIVDRQRVARKLTPDETSQVIRLSALKPDLHFKDVQTNAQAVKQHDKAYSSFGLDLDMKPIEVSGRELPQISILGGGQQRMATNNGEYDNRRVRFVRAAVVSRWSILLLVDEFVKRSYRDINHLKSEGDRFAAMYARAGFNKGVKIDKKNAVVDVIMLDQDDNQLKNGLGKYFEMLNSNGFQHCLAVLPDKTPDWAYSFLQYLEASAKGTRKADEPRTRVSCLKFNNYHRKILGEPPNNQFKIDMFLNNLWLKHNTKLGGINIVLDGNQTFGVQPQSLTKFLSPGYLFVSIDVCHPAPGDRLKQSVAAAVGMWNITNPLMSYCTRLRVQRKDRSDQDKSTVEEVGEIGVMFADILKSYEKQTGGKMPENVVVLRDGVSEGQFSMVLNKELVQIKQVLSNEYSKKKLNEPKLTCLTVQKRHKVRFMRKDPVKDRRGNNDFNIQPGTVVDSEVTAPNDFSFYLAPHKAIQGTARAPHIYMIYDQIKFSQDSAQAMIFALSYLSPRCTKGTSIPTPVNLADLAAERGKNLVVSWNEANARTRLTDEERLAKLNGFLSNLGETNYQNTMFYI